MLVIFYILGFLTASAAAALIALFRRDKHREKPGDNYDDFLKY